MATQDDDDMAPAFAATIDSILERFQSSAVERQNAVRALTAITLALAPEHLFVEDDESRLNIYFGAQLDRLHAGEEGTIRKDVIALISAAERGDATARQRLR